MNRCWWFEHISTEIDNAAIYDILNQSSVKTCPKTQIPNLVGKEIFSYMSFFSLFNNLLF